MAGRDGALLVLGLVLMSAIYLAVTMLTPARELTHPVEIRVKRGMSLTGALLLLEQRGLVRDTRPMWLMGVMSGLHRRVIPGFYRFYGSPTPWDIYNKLASGEIITERVTIVEGDSLNVIAGRFVEAGLIANTVEFLGLASAPPLLATLGIEAPSAEGYIYPDTYMFHKGASPEEMIATMAGRLRKVYGPDLIARTKALGMTRHEVLTLASIIEKEAQLDRERAIVSAVYHNRLRLGMRLQADPTSVYGIKDQSEGIRSSDLRRVTPYNTYVIDGLPPGPIASPGIASIRAALYPANVPYLYFVAVGDGSHAFTSTFSEHQRAVAEYRRVMQEKKTMEAALNRI